MRKLFEVYFMNDEPLPHGRAGRASIVRSPRSASNYDVVIAADFGHGLIAAILDRSVDRERALSGGEHAKQQRQSRL